MMGRLDKQGAKILTLSLNTLNNEIHWVSERQLIALLYFADAQNPYELRMQTSIGQ